MKHFILGIIDMSNKFKYLNKLTLMSKMPLWYCKSESGVKRYFSNAEKQLGNGKPEIEKSNVLSMF